jgi:hypothetical protein
MIYPLCFKSRKQFAEWAKLAVQAREEATPCSDCTPAYKQSMTAIHCCNEKQVIEQFRHIPTSRYKKKEVTPT